MKKRILSLALAVCVLASALPFPASAQDSWLCGLEEHSHTEAECYAPGYICGQESGHLNHDDACFTLEEGWYVRFMSMGRNAKDWCWPARRRSMSIMTTAGAFAQSAVSWMR